MEFRSSGVEEFRQYNWTYSLPYNLITLQPYNLTTSKPYTHNLGSKKVIE